MRTTVIGVLALLGLTGCESTVIDGEGLTAITNVTLIDGTGAPPQADMSVVLQDDRITRISGAASVRFGPDVTVVDAHGKWLVPGFIDTHAHISGANDLTERLQALLDHGITAARSPATVTEFGVDVRDRVGRGELAGPVFRVAGALIDSPGSPWGFAAIVSSEDEVRAEVRSQAQAGVDYIKLYTLLPPEIVGAAIDEAHTLDLKVIGHLGRTSWFEAIDLGIDALTHSAIAGLASSMVRARRREEFGDFFIPNGEFDPSQFGSWLEAVRADTGTVEELGRQLAEQDVVLDPNLVLMEAILRGDDRELYELLVPPANRRQFRPHPYSAGWSEAERADAEESLSYFFDAVRIFHEAGALITAGTDIGNPWMTPGVSFHRELELLARAGLTNLDVIVAATRNGAEAIDLLDQRGTIELGKLGDLVLLSADPLADIRNTRKIDAVYQSGRRVDSN